MPLPLLPKIERPREDWSPFEDNGLQKIDPIDFKNRLYNIENINASGIPDILAYPFTFSKNLENDNSDTYEQFSILIRGIFLGIIRPVVFKLEELGRLGDIIKCFHKDIDAFIALKWHDKHHDKYIGGIYHESIVFSAIEPGNKNKPDEIKNDFKEIDKENNDKEGYLGKDEVRGNFRRWVKNITAKNGDATWASYLWKITKNEWNIHENKVPSELVNVVTIVNASVSRNDQNIVQIPLSCYLGHTIMCNHNDQPVSLSNENTTLSLGAGKMIMCNESIPGCTGCEMVGRGPRIDEAGFFERSRGKYIIWEDTEREKMPGGCTHIEYHKSESQHSLEYAILTFGKLKIKIEGRVVNKNDILCRNIVRFNSEMLPDLPIKSEYLDCVDEDTNNMERGPAYSIRLKGNRKLEMEYSSDDILEAGEASILLFPSFKHPGWKANYILFYWPKIDETKPNLKITPLNTGDKEVIYNEDNRDAAFTIKYSVINQLAEGLDSLQGIKTNQKITHIEILENSESKGIYFSRQNQLFNDGGGKVRLSLDFGTSNSIFAYHDARASYKVLELKDMTTDILDNTGLDRRLVLNGGWWLPSFIPENDEDYKVLTSIPSELLFRKSRDIDVDSLKTPISKYTIPHPSYKRLDKDCSKCVILDFKWMSPPPFETPTKNKEVKTKYLEMLMHMALATIYDMGYNSIDFTTTYPLAFGYNKYKEYKELLQGEIIPSVSRETGMTVNFPVNTYDDTIEFVSESSAARARFSTADHQIVVDIGGGTTDISLSKDGNLLVIDSIEYGGNHFVAALAKESNLISSALKISDDLKLNELELQIMINRVIRSEDGFKKAILDNIDNTDTGKIERINCKLEFFINGILEYIKILVTKYNIKGKATLYPVGNAWKFMEASTNNIGLEEYIKDYLGKEFEVNMGAYESGKQVVAEGALQNTRFRHPDLHLPVKTIAGCDGIQIGAEYIDKNAEIPYYLSMDDQDSAKPPNASTKTFIDNYQRKPIGSVGLSTIFEEFNTEIENALYLSGESDFNKDPSKSKWCLRKSPFVIFLEKIIPKYYL